MLGQLPLNALIAFEAAARHLSFKRAAEELHVTPAAISQQIRSLEDLMGVTLFHRLPRGIALTPVAEASLPLLRQGLELVSEATSRMRGAVRDNGLNVWMAPSFAVKWMVPRLKGFSERHPDITTSITASAELMDRGDGAIAFPASALREHDVDVAIRFGRGVYPGCRVEKLMPAVALPLCSPELLEQDDHPLRHPRDLVHHTLLHDDTPYEGRPDWDTWLAAAGVDGVDASRGIRFNHVSLALEAAAAGQGVVLSIGQLASADIAAGRLVVPFDTQVPLDYAYYLISLEESTNRENVDAFRDWVLNEARGAGEMTPGVAVSPPGVVAASPGAAASPPGSGRPRRIGRDRAA